MLRIFIVKSPTATTSPNFPLKGIAGATGRLDVICRSIISAFKLKSGFRRNTVFYGVLCGPPQPPLTVVVDGRKATTIPLNEIEVARVIRDLIRAYSSGETHSYSGWSIYRWDLRKVINSILSSMRALLIYLKEDGENVEKVLNKINTYMRDYDSIVFVLGSHVDLDPDDEKILEEHNALRVSIGPYSYLSSHVITYVHYILDTLGKR
ncbi:MAG TPA: hypothetical protein EYH40_03495 [Desulfurococcales archaeon]|nr:hypothetical protein [Desulfurococcales archaeon]